MVLVATFLMYAFGLGEQLCLKTTKSFFLFYDGQSFFILLRRFGENVCFEVIGIRILVLFELYRKLCVPITLFLQKLGGKFCFKSRILVLSIKFYLNCIGNYVDRYYLNWLQLLGIIFCLEKNFKYQLFLFRIRHLIQLEVQYTSNMK